MIHSLAVAGTMPPGPIMIWHRAALPCNFPENEHQIRQAEAISHTYIYIYILAK